MQEQLTKSIEQKLTAFDERMRKRLGAAADEEAERNARKVVELQVAYMQRTGRTAIRP